MKAISIIFFKDVCKISLIDRSSKRAIYLNDEILCRNFAPKVECVFVCKWWTILSLVTSSVGVIVLLLHGFCIFLYLVYVYNILL